MKYRRISFWICLFVCFVCLTSCSQRYSYEGLDRLRKSGGGISENHITSHLFLNLAFLDDFSYNDGNFYYENTGVIFNELDCSFAWLSYDESTYLQAKAKYLSSYLPENAKNNMADAFEYTFFINEKYADNDFWRFPHWFTAFGYNDAEQKLVFIGFHCTRNDESEYVSLAETDFGAFLEHFYGEWYDWK